MVKLYSGMLQIRTAAAIDILPHSRKWILTIQKATIRGLKLKHLSLSLIAIFTLGGVIGPSHAQDAGIAGAYEGCKAVADEKLRLKCFDSLLRPDDKNAASQRGRDPWRLLRTPDPRGGREAVSIIRTVDPLRSDPDIAGLMLRCGEKADVEVLVALLRPLSFRSHPLVKVTAGTNKFSYPAKVVAPGELVLLPEEAAALAMGPWQQMHELDVAIEDPELNSHAIIPLDGLPAGLVTLRASCPRQDVQQPPR
jgi:hypothetical protein